MSEPEPTAPSPGTFLRTTPEGEPAPATDARMQDEARHATPVEQMQAEPIDLARPPATEMRHDDDVVIVDEAAAIEPAPVAVQATAVASDAPSFLGSARTRTLPTPRWHWLLVAGLALLLVLQSVLADRARLAADATQPRMAGHAVRRAALQPACWHEPTAFTMTSREIRPLPGQGRCAAGAGQHPQRCALGTGVAGPAVVIVRCRWPGDRQRRVVPRPRSTWARTPVQPCWNRARARASPSGCRSPLRPPSHSPSTSS